MDNKYMNAIPVVLLVALIAIGGVFASLNRWPSTRLATMVDATYDASLHFALNRPTGRDTLPLIIFIHPGAFCVGEYNDFLIMSMAKDFARAGFVTASIEYPQISDDLLGVHIRKREMEAVASAKKAAIFFTQNATTYMIDTSKIFVCGYSAGGIIALHSLFTNANEANEYSQNRLFSSLSPDIQSTLDAPNPFKGVIAISGGMLDMNHVQDADFKCPILLIHGKNDSIFPFNVGKPFDKYTGDYEVEIPGLALELGIGDETTIGLGESFKLPGSFLTLFRNVFFNDVYGSGEIFKQYKDVDNIDLQLISIRGGHNFLLTKKGTFSKKYYRLRKKIRAFINDQL